MITELQPQRSAGRSTAARLAASSLVLMGALALSACEGGTTSTGVPCPSSKAAVGGLEYKLGVGDKVRITVVGQPELGSEAEVDAGGKIVIALAGEVDAVDHT